MHVIDSPSRMSMYRYWLAAIIFVLIAVIAIPSPAFADPDTATHKIFLPVISGQVPEVAPSCGLNAQEQRIETLFLEHPNQGRVTMVCNPTLAAVARARALDMGQRGYFGHVNPEGQGPNYAVRQAGYMLPAEYSTEISSNNIESIGAGAGDADTMWNGWVTSGKHSLHILAANEFYAEQIEYGIGFAEVPGSPYSYYWVFISSKPGG